MILQSRIDSRLIHGQVVEGWVPHLGVKRLVVADDAAAHDELTRAAMALAVPDSVEVRLCGVDELDLPSLSADPTPTLLLFRDVASLQRARARGLPDGVVTLGNVHAGAGRTAISRSVYLLASERDALAQLVTSGMRVVAQATPAEKPLVVQ